MRTVDVIRKKRDGGELSREELAHIVEGYTKGEVPDYQVSAFVMAVYFIGLQDNEVGDLTDLIMRSGVKLDLSEIPGVKVDKHSTGGVGDKTSLIVAPLVAAAGVLVPMISGIRKMSPQRAKAMLGIAASRSITAMSGRRSRSGAYSEM